MDQKATGSPKDLPHIQEAGFANLSPHWWMSLLSSHRKWNLPQGRSASFPREAHGESFWPPKALLNSPPEQTVCYTFLPALVWIIHALLNSLWPPPRLKGHPERHSTVSDIQSWKRFFTVRKVMSGRFLGPSHLVLDLWVEPVRRIIFISVRL